MAYRDSTTNNGATSGGTQPNCTIPTGVVADDIVILTCSVDAGADTLTPPSGFANFTGFTANPAADGQSCAAAWKRATGSESGTYTWSGATVPRDFVCQAIAFSGRHTTDPPVGGTVKVESSVLTSVVTIAANGVTAVAGDDLVWISLLDPTTGDAGWVHGAPSGYSEKEDDNRAWTAASIAIKENDGGGATGTVNGTATLSGKNTGYASILVRVPVAAAAAGQPITKRLGGVQFTASRAPAQQGMRQW